ncbi:hypothetical protein THASP1DRAFT_33043 [Thamnocephalis sphaerospora]|uniref:Uncharacterized protein n=1 Tax=Thamnocephalis sphaerospora TaxID=78915 RepID=A0A4P9XHM2_9FUNG|nr:hypothetical protein THASP1DRAFT_33043 [Thamnocephalis sphaerospora]|eukprot:RKP05117.1 hypothetical protein THASP1DRAFT_33043 [Thamnocephalis sphaerospora]
MNYLTAIIAAPLFVGLFFLEVYFYICRSSRNTLHLMLTRIFLLVSFLQAISSLFWFFGYVRSTLNGIMSEGYGVGERIDCFGIVGAEVLLAIFQYIMTMVSCLQMIRILQVDTSLRKVARSGLSNPRYRYHWVLYAIGLVMLAYTGIAFITAYNRRCPQATPKILPQIQHYFYPVYLGVDVVLFSITIWKLRKLERILEENRRRLIGLTPTQTEPLSPPCTSNGSNSRYPTDVPASSQWWGTTASQSTEQLSSTGAPFGADSPPIPSHPTIAVASPQGSYFPSQPHKERVGSPKFALTSQLYQASQARPPSPVRLTLPPTRHGTTVTVEQESHNMHGHRNINALHELTRLHRQQLVVTLATCAFGIALYIVQFTADVEVLSIVLCCFCVCMYIGYALRRTPFMMYYTGRKLRWIGPSHRATTISYEGLSTSRHDGRPSATS